MPDDTCPEWDGKIKNYLKIKYPIGLPCDLDIKNDSHLNWLLNQKRRVKNNYVSSDFAMICMLY